MTTAMIPFEEMLPASQGWTTLKQQAGELIRSGFLPSGIKTPEQAVAIILKGRELGIPPMQALSHIHVINGKPTMSAELMLAQIMRLHPKTKISYPKRTSEVCEVKVQRDGSDASVFSFSMADAQAAGLLNNPTWKKYPRAMLHARCVSEMARSLFPDAISGVSYTPEEMGAAVSENGEVIDVQPTEVSNAAKDSKETQPQKNVVANASDNVVVAETTPASPDDTVGPESFSKVNPVHIRKITAWLKQKNALGVFAPMCGAMDGKPFNTKTVDEVFAKVVIDEQVKEAAK